jgi:hypothetical protein
MKTQAIAVNTQAINVQPESHNRRDKGTMKMQNIRKRIPVLALFVLLLAMMSHASAQTDSPLNIGEEGHRAHILPPPSATLGLAGAPSVPLTFHGGPVMESPSTYAIFWIPQSGKLQNGNPTGMPYPYTNVQLELLGNYPGHGIGSNNTQYSSNCFTNVSVSDFICYPFGLYYIDNLHGLKDAHLESSDYPPSGCNDPATPGNCLSDAQIQAEILKVMKLRGWTGGLNTMFLLFTSSGEGSCFGSSCAYTAYCAYHSYINVGGHAVIYGNEPYGNVNVCQVPGTPSPNNDPEADTAATAASHELTEAITDPLLNAWYDAYGNEIGDKCAYKYGTNTWDSGQANQMWGGGLFGGTLFFELQMEYDNHTASCVQVGP